METFSSFTNAGLSVIRINPTPTVISGNTTVPSVAGTYYYNVDTSAGAVTITLPDPSMNIIIEIKDANGTFGTNACTLARNGSENIEGLGANLVLRAPWGKYQVRSVGGNWFKSEAKNRVEITYAASSSVTIPAGVTRVQALGRGGAGGGGGGGAGNGGAGGIAAAGGAAGSQGQCCISKMQWATVVPGTTYTITIGAGGAAGTAGTVTAAAVGGSIGGGGGAGGTGGDTSFGAILTWRGANNASNGGVASGLFSTAGSSGGQNIGRDILAASGGSGGAAGAAGNAGTGGLSTSGGNRSSVGTVGSSGAGVGGGGGAGGGQSAADGDGPTAANGGNGGASGANGSAGSQGGVASNGCGGPGGGGGGGGGLLATTGSQGGAGGAGRAGSDGVLTISWLE